MAKEQGGSRDGSSASEVLQEVGNMTGLPEEYLDQEISTLLGTAGESVNNMSLDQLRVVLMNYLETLNDEMTQEQTKH